MERYNQFRDRGSGIAPFLPAPLTPVPTWCPLPLRALLFIFRLPFLIFAFVAYFAVLQWLPIGSLGKKAALWCILAVPSIWWVDLQVEGVRKGQLSKQKSRLPGPGSVIAASFTSPIDALYLAAIFDPIFTASYAETKKVEHISLFEAIVRAFDLPETHYEPRPGAQLVTIEELQRKYPGRPIAVFPECTTSNGHGVLPLSASLTTFLSSSKIFPISIRYQPEDVVTPLPGHYINFLWALLSRPTHCIFVRIAEPIGALGGRPLVHEKAETSTIQTNHFDLMNEVSPPEGGRAKKVKIDLSPSEKNLVDAVGEALARMGRVRRVGLGVYDKEVFLYHWNKLHRE
ncbi:lysophosphatidic acid acyltransferase LOA1 [Aspergillus mulundensis]|uniref:Phospholipid/glycerol acyltransferase domain-containing protein n=1 Tax=Aspergillus mulundensis TaxID=1810919 RepID=A0A3D8SVT4_9EURO|nr:hypothetical protein DSM5745_02046 [Aspergillus mulundensis]RDW90271.1 hypothetical protein DSM5745_02046 [Aspergillus mulundensis]